MCETTQCLHNRINLRTHLNYLHIQFYNLLTYITVNTFLPLPIIWSYHFLTIFRGVVESKSEKVGEVKLKNFKKQPCTFEALQQKTEVKKRKEKRELARLLGIVVICW